MKNSLSAVIVLTLFSAAAQNLTCQRCPLGLLSMCLFDDEVTCNNATHSCFRGQAQFNATGSLTLHIRGCLDSDLCGKTLTGDILGSGYTTSFQCCETNLCNGAASVPLPLAVALCAATLSSLWAMWE